MAHLAQTVTQHGANEYPTNYRWLAILPALAIAALVLPFEYRNVLGEIDLSQMAFAIVHGHATGLRDAAGYHYGNSFSFGYYFAFYHFAPSVVLSSVSALITVINAVGYGSAVVGVSLLGLYVTRLYGVGAAIVATSIFAFSPMFLELSTSGHPELPAFCLLMLGAYLLTFVTDVGISAFRRRLTAIAAVAALLAALCVRSDVVLALPFIAVAGRSDHQSFKACARDAVPRIILIALVFVCFLLLQRVALGTSEASGGQALLNYLKYGDDPNLIAKGVAVLALGTGLASVALCTFLLISGSARRLSATEAVAVGSIVFLSLVLWLPNPTPARHFLVFSLAVSLFIGLALGRRYSLIAAISVAILMPIANQIVGEILYPTVAAHYNWSYPSLTERRATMSVPIGAFSRNHRANQERFSYFRREGIALAQACSKNGKLLVFADEPYYYLMALAEHESTMRIYTTEEFGTRPIHVSGSSCETTVVTKYVAWPQDPVANFLNEATYQDWPVYFQELTRGKWDQTPIPKSRMTNLSLDEVGF